MRKYYYDNLLAGEMDATIDITALPHDLARQIRDFVKSHYDKPITRLKIEFIGDIVSDLPFDLREQIIRTHPEIGYEINRSTRRAAELEFNILECLKPPTVEEIANFTWESDRISAVIGKKHLIGLFGYPEGDGTTIIKVKEWYGFNDEIGLYAIEIRAEKIETLEDETWGRLIGVDYLTLYEIKNSRPVCENVNIMDSIVDLYNMNFSNQKVEEMLNGFNNRLKPGEWWIETLIANAMIIGDWKPQSDTILVIDCQRSVSDPPDPKIRQQLLTN